MATKWNRWEKAMAAVAFAEIAEYDTAADWMAANEAADTGGWRRWLEKTLMGITWAEAGCDHYLARC